jgi:hypothetical protein
MTTYGLLVWALKLSEDAALVTGTWMACFAILYLAAGSFDAKPHRWQDMLMGVTMKVLAVGHAVGALKLAYRFSQQGMPPNWHVLLFQARWLLACGLWLMAVLLYLAGDSRFRKGRAKNSLRA